MEFGDSGSGRLRLTLPHTPVHSLVPVIPNEVRNLMLIPRERDCVLAFGGSDFSLRFEMTLVESWTREVFSADYA
jgi:hypothetical protein